MLRFRRSFISIASPTSSPEAAKIFSHPLLALLKERKFQQVSHLLYDDERHLDGSLTGQTLSSGGKIAKYPVFFSLLAYNKEKEVTSSVKNIKPDYNELYAFYHLGSKLNGHPGIVHGGFMATILDEALYRCLYPLIIQRGKKNFGVTAYLNLDYRSPTWSDLYVVVKSRITHVDGRKFFIDGKVETLAFDNEEPTVLVEAKQLIVIPKWLEDK